jgi:hypothetical protein
MIHRLTRTVFVQQDSAHQGAGSKGWSLFGAPSKSDSIKVSHAVNFYRAGALGEKTQLLTANSMIDAVALSRDVQLLAVVHENEKDAVPRSFEIAPPLRRTVADVHKFASARPFPLLFDILASAAAGAQPGSYLVYTNSDICLVPSFYRTVRSILARGVDCVVTNRRTVAPLESFGDAPEVAALEVGWAHPGFDCFVFPTAWVEDFVANAACVGIGWVMRSLLYNLVVKARRMVILRNAHLTYHYGDDRPWNAPGLEEYTQHNLGEARAVVKALSNDPAKKLALDEFCSAHGEYETEIFSTVERKGRRVTLAKVAKKIASWGGSRTRSR